MARSGTIKKIAVSQESNPKRTFARGDSDDSMMPTRNPSRALAGWLDCSELAFCLQQIDV
jgi:hypothetical protein